MDRDTKNLAFLQAFTYFQNFSQQKPNFTQFEKHLVSLQQFLQHRESISNITENITQRLLNIFCITYKKLSAAQFQIEQYLIIKFIKATQHIYNLSLTKSNKQQPLYKNIYAIFFSANILNIKKIISIKNHHQVAFLQAILTFNKSLVADCVSSFPKCISEFYPGLYSCLSNILRFEWINLKNMGLVVENMKLLVGGIGLTRQMIDKSSNDNDLDRRNGECETDEFKMLYLDRLIEDIKFMILKYYQVQFNYQIKFHNFNHFLVNKFSSIFTQTYQNIKIIKLETLITNNLSSKVMELFRTLLTFSQITSNNQFLSLNFSPYLNQIMKQENKKRFIQSCNCLRVDANINLKKRQLKHMANLIKFIEIPCEQSSQLFIEMVNFIKYIFQIKHQNLISIPHTSSSIPLQQLKASHTKNNYAIKDVFKQYKSQLNRMLLQIIPFFEFQVGLIEMVDDLFDRMGMESRQNVLKYLIDELLQYQYKLDMSLTNFYQYLSRLVVIRFLISTNLQFKAINIISNLFTILANKTQSVITLKPAYIEEEIVISITLQIIYTSFQLLKKQYSTTNIKHKIKLTQSTILITQKILNSITEQSYLIKLISIYTLLSFTDSQPLQSTLKPVQTTLLQRNKTNMLLVRTLLQLTKLNQVDYEELTFQYMKFKNCEPVLLYLLPRISIQSCRKCILAAEKWWLLLTRETVEYLNEKEIKRATNQGQAFFVKDQQNVVIKNALGVIILQLSDKWLFYLKSQKRQTIIDIIIIILEVNTNLVFFRSFFTKILTQMFYILCQCLGYDKQQVLKRETYDEIKKVVRLQIGNRGQFYDRLKLKIYRILIEIPREYIQSWSKDSIHNLRSMLQNEETELKKAYFLKAQLNLQQQYQLLGTVLSRLRWE